MKLTEEKMLATLHTKLISTLTQRIEDGSATAADLAVARQLLKDNGIQAQSPKDSPLAHLTDAMPFPIEQDETYN